MSLITFDMGRRIETPVTSPRRRVSRLSGIHHTHVINTGSRGVGTEGQQEESYPDDMTSMVYSRDGHQHEFDHSPQAIALTSGIMIHPVISIEEQATIGNAYTIMQQHSINHLPVIDDQQRILAIVSDRLILRTLVEQIASVKSPILDIAIRPVYYTTGDADIRQTAHLLCDYHIGALPVINDKEQLIGMVTSSDLLKVISDYGPLELWA